MAFAFRQDCPTLLLPGLICDEAIWSHQTTRLNECGVRVAHGYRLCRRIEDMAKVVLDHAPDEFNLCGHSMGGRVALEVYRLAPDRIRKLALFDTGVHLPRPGEREQRYALFEVGKSKGMEALVDEWLPPMVAAAHRTNPQKMRSMRDMACRAGLDGFEAQMCALLDRPEVETLLGSIRVPVTLGVGSEDVWSSPSQHRSIARSIPQAQLIIFEGAGHMSPVEAPDHVTNALAVWLADAANHR